jgi:hypothetical protein
MRPLFLFAIAAAALDLAAQTPHIDYVKPFRIKADPAGVAEVSIYGTFPMATEGHPDRSQYEHWFIRRVGETDWQECSRTEPPCSMNGWSGGLEKFKLSGGLIAKPGLLEMKVNEGLVTKSADSNIIRIPVLEAFGAPPMIVSISRTAFPSGGAAGEYIFRIAANNFDPSNVRVGFRDDPDVIYPGRVLEGTTIEVTVPEKFRSLTGELPIFLRTDSGGDSEVKYIKFVKTEAARVVPAGRTLPGSLATVTVAPMTISPDLVLATRVRKAIEERLGIDTVKSLSVTASKGAVTFSGISSADLQSRINGIATNVAGVTSVQWK